MFSCLTQCKECNRFFSSLLCFYFCRCVFVLFLLSFRFFYLPAAGQYKLKSAPRPVAVIGVCARVIEGNSGLVYKARIRSLSEQCQCQCQETRRNSPDVFILLPPAKQKEGGAYPQNSSARIGGEGGTSLSYGTRHFPLTSRKREIAQSLALCGGLIGVETTPTSLQAKSLSESEEEFNSEFQSSPRSEALNPTGKSRRRREERIRA